MHAQATEQQEVDSIESVSILLREVASQVILPRFKKLAADETGGKAARFDGCPYKPAEQAFGLLAAQTPELWSDLQEKLFRGTYTLS